MAWLRSMPRAPHQQSASGRGHLPAIFRPGLRPAPPPSGRGLPRAGLPATSSWTAEERRAVHEIIHSIFELYELKVHGFFPPADSTSESPISKGCCRCPCFQQELTSFEGRYASHPRLAAWLAKIRGQQAEFSGLAQSIGRAASAPPQRRSDVREDRLDRMRAIVDGRAAGSGSSTATCRPQVIASSCRNCSISTSGSARVQLRPKIARVRGSMNPI